MAVPPVYLVRHCKATGQAPNASLTSEGEAQTAALSELLADRGIGRIVSSPYLRARESIAPLAARLGRAVELDDRLRERVLTTAPCPDWLDRLRESFDDLDLRLEGGESSRDAMARGGAVLDEVRREGSQPAVLVTHGNLMALMLRHFDPAVGFDRWRTLSNPDVYRVENGTVERIWPD